MVGQVQVIITFIFIIICKTQAWRLNRNISRFRLFAIKIDRQVARHFANLGGTCPIVLGIEINIQIIIAILLGHKFGFNNLSDLGVDFHENLVVQNLFLYRQA